MDSINVIGLTLLGLFGILILQKKSKQNFDYLLLVIAGLMAILLATDIQLSSEVTSWSLACEILVPYFLIAVFYLYVRALLEPNSRLRLHDLLYFLPGVIAFSWVTWDLGTHLYDEAALELLCQSPHTSYRMVKIGYQVFSIGILVPVLFRLKRHQESLKNNLSYIDPYQLNWLWHLTWIYLAVIVITMATFGSYSMGVFEGNFGWTHSIANISMVLGVSLCCYKGIRQYSWEFFKQAQAPVSVSPEASQDADTRKYEHSSLREEEMDNMYQQLLVLFEEKEIYLQPKLSVQDLADELHVTPHALSQMLNSKIGQPFYDFVNNYRVEHLKELLKDPSNQAYTILALGLDSGFNSKASLNRIFKNHTGMTPSTFQRLQLGDNYPSNPRHSLG